jgi:hypothetical protein
MSEQAGNDPLAGEWQDMQGLLRFGHGRLTQARFLLLRVKHAEAARAWLAATPVTSAATVRPLRDTALQIALTSDGLRALDVAPDIIDAFSNEFLAGMSNDAGRSRRLGDVAHNAPQHWAWGSDARMPHVLVMLYAVPGALEDFQRGIEAGCAQAFDILQRLDTATLDRTEPFGFVDGISQPQVDWKRERPVVDEEEVHYRNLSCLGEYVLGYPNEYGAYTARRRGGAGACGRGARKGRPRAQRQLSGAAPVAAGCARLLALRE